MKHFKQKWLGREAVLESEKVCFRGVVVECSFRQGDFSCDYALRVEGEEFVVGIFPRGRNPRRTTLDPRLGFLKTNQLILIDQYKQSYQIL